MNTVTRRTRRGALVLAAAAMLPLALTACSSDDGKDKAASDTKSSAASDTASGKADDSGSGDTNNADEPFGPACASVPKDGAGSFDGMAKDPVATAASNNPALSTLVTAVKKAGLVDTLNNAQNITVFAPTNDAFAKIPKADLDKVLNDKATLTKILTYHVVGAEARAQGPGERLVHDAGEVEADDRGLRRVLQGQRLRQCGLRQRQDRQRQRQHHRHGADAEVVTRAAAGSRPPTVDRWRTAPRRRASSSAARRIFDPHPSLRLFSRIQSISMPSSPPHVQPDMHLPFLAFQETTNSPFQYGDPVGETRRIRSVRPLPLTQQALYLGKLKFHVGKAVLFLGGFRRYVDRQEACQLLGLIGKLTVLAVQFQEDVDLGAQQPGVDGLDEEVGRADGVSAVGVVRVDVRARSAG